MRFSVCRPPSPLKAGGNFIDLRIKIKTSVFNLCKMLLKFYSFNVALASRLVQVRKTLVQRFFLVFVDDHEVYVSWFFLLL